MALLLGACGQNRSSENEAAASTDNQAGPVANLPAAVPNDGAVAQLIRAGSSEACSHPAVQSLLRTRLTEDMERFLSIRTPGSRVWKAEEIAQAKRLVGQPQVDGFGAGVGGVSGRVACQAMVHAPGRVSQTSAVLFTLAPLPGNAAGFSLDGDLSAGQATYAYSLRQRLENRSPDDADASGGAAIFSPGNSF